MTAICKTILIHGDNLQGILDYGSDTEKTSLIQNDLDRAMEYAANPLKTLANLDDGHKELLVSGVLCQPESAVLDFGIVKEKYIALNDVEQYATFDYMDKRTNESHIVHKKPVTAIHLIQSFSETDLDPQMVHQMGIELCERLGVQAVVDTHMNKKHLHNHIIINAYMPDGQTKFIMNTEQRIKLRELSDEIQRAHGIELKLSNPRQQLSMSLGNNSYREWSSKQQGISWKEEMKNDMADARSVSDSREDFITIMQDYGYEIARQEANSITWWNKNHTKKIRDRTLGEAYMLGTMFSADIPEMVVGRESKYSKKHPKRISIARYDWNGRRRGDLELIIRKAIALIQIMGSRYQAKGYSSTLTTSKKLEMMERAMETVLDMGLENYEELEKKMDTVGAKLNHTKSLLQRMEGQKVFYDNIASSIASYKATKQIVDSIRYWPDRKMPDLMLPSYSETETQKARAALSPMTGEQKRELYLILKKHPEYTLAGEGFDGVSSYDAENIFAYFKGNTEQPPACLRKSVDVTMEQVYHKRNEYLKQRFDKPIQKYQEKEITALLEAQGKQVDISTLSQYDAMNIRNCYGENPFGEAPISEEQRNYLSKKLQAFQLSINRDIPYVLPSEYGKILDYLDGLSHSVPSLLKESVSVSESDLENLKLFMEAKGITSSIPLSAMNKSDYDKMYGYVISQGHTPDCLTPKQADRTEEFVHSIEKEGITEKKFLLLLQLRNDTIQLLKHGIDPTKLEELSNSIQSFKSEYESLELQRAELSGEYKTLIDLRQQMTYAESPNFLYGPLFNEKVHEIPIISETKERDKKPQKHFDTDIEL